MKLNPKITLTWLMSALYCGLSSAATVYVDQTTGDDTNNGLTPNSAVATISQGSTLIATGDTLNIGRGIYSASSGENLPVVFSDSVALQGAGPEQTILDGELSSSLLVLTGTTATVSIDGLAIINSADSIGAGIKVGAITQLKLSNCRFENNDGSIGGGIIISNTPEISVSKCEFNGNVAAIGGAIQVQINNDIDVVMQVVDSIFSNNTANIGSAIQFQENGTGVHSLSIDRSRFLNNSATGVNFSRNAGTSIGQITNSLFAEHPGVALHGGSTALNVVNATFVNNQQALGVGEQSSIVNSIFWGNTAVLSGPSQSSIAFSIIQGLAIGGLTDEGNNMDIDPLLEDGYRLAFNSPAIDMGSDQAIDVLGLTQDLDGKARKFDLLSLNRPEGVVDIGADENNYIIFSDGFE